MLYRTDYHIHSEYSDGKASPEDYIQFAIGCGLNEIGFSEHLNLVYEDTGWCIDHKRIPEYLAHIASLKNSTDRIYIRTGFEVDFFPGTEKQIYDFITPLNLDFVIGSVHYIGESTVDASEDFYDGKDFNQIFKEYFDLVLEAVTSGLFDFIAHFDLIRIFGGRFNGNPEYLYRHLAETMARYEVAFELNTNGLNKPLGDFYPDVRFIHLFREAGVPVCVNSDAHLPSRVGEYFNDAYKLLKNAGYSEMCTFSKRERVMIQANFP